MEKRHGVVISKTGLIIGLLSLSFVALAGQAQAAIQCYDCHGDRTIGILKPKDSYSDMAASNLRNATTGAFLGDHETHLGTAPTANDCVKCHNNQNYTSSHAALGNFKIQINPALNNFSTSFGRARYGKPTFFNQTSIPQTSSCSNVNCHFVSKPTDQWGTRPYATADATTCSKCHDAIPASNAHTKHITYLGGTTSACSRCHNNYPAAPKPFQHATSAGRRPISVSFSNFSGSYSGGNTLFFPGQTGRVVGSCSNVYCHSNGRKVYTSPQWSSTNTAGCTFCHPNLSATHLKHVATIATATYGNTANNTTDAAYDFGCGNCHPINPANHINGYIELTLNNTHGGPLKSKNKVAVDNAGYTQNVGVSVTCSAAYCHSTGFATNLTFVTSPDWYGTFTGDRCSMCHGNSPNSDSVNKPGSPAHNAHAVGIHYDDIYNGVSGKYGYYSSATKPSAHGDPIQATIISCDICHNNTVATDPAGKNANDKNSICVTCHSSKSRVPTIKRAAHVNGSVDVVFAPVNVRSKAQIRDASFSSYTAVWSRTTYKVDSGSYDTAKKSLNQATFSAGTTAGQGTCATVSCHNGYTVRWNDTVTCDSCHSRL